MRRDDDVRHPEQRRGRRRFLGEHVQRRARDMTRFQRLGQRRLVDQPAARAVDDPDTLFRRRDGLLRQDVPRLVGQRNMQRDEVRPRQQLVQLDLGDTHMRRAVIRQEGIIGQHLHPKTQRAVADNRPDVPRADHAQRLVEDLRPHEAVLFPLAGMGRGRRLRQLPRDGEHHGNGVFGCRDRVSEGRVHHDHALFRRRRNIDIVHPDPGPPDHLQPRRRRQHLVADLGGGPDGETIVIADDGEQLFLVLAEIGQVVDLHPAVAEDLHGGFGEGVGNEDFRGHDRGPFRDCHPRAGGGPCSGKGGSPLARG